MFESTEQAIAILKDDQRAGAEREDAIGYLQDHPSDTGTEALVYGLKDRDSGVRWACARALANMGEYGLPTLLAALSSPRNDPMLREGAHRVLVHNSSAKVRRETQELLKALEGQGAEMASMEEAGRLLLKWQSKG